MSSQVNEQYAEAILIEGNNQPVASRNSWGWKSKHWIWPSWYLKSCNSFPAVKSHTCWYIDHDKDHCKSSPESTTKLKSNMCIHTAYTCAFKSVFKVKTFHQT